MPFALAKEYSRLWSLNAGVAMVITDLHGDWETYQRYRDCFIDLHARGKADCIIFAGDLIHAEPDKLPDRSVEIVLDVLKLRARFGDAVIYLCGNHELPHIYGYGLAKGTTEYTPAFEKQMSQSQTRTEITNLFLTLPFYIRTTAGVTITHAGASPMVSSLNSARKLFNWCHKDVLIEARSKFSKSDKEELRRAYAKLSHVESYKELAIKYLSVAGVDDPRYDDLLLGFFATSVDGFDILYSAISTGCELEFNPETYNASLINLLKYLSLEYSTQNILVSGHITVQDGYQTVAENHLRIASGSHAKPLHTGKYLLLNTAQPTENIENLLEGLCSVF